MLFSLALLGLAATFVSGQTPTVTGCAAVAEYQSKFLQASPKATALTGIPAATAYDCLMEIPINNTAASDFVNWYRFYLDFQSTSAILRNPPPSYLQPATDLLGGLDTIQAAVESGKYANQYDFEVDVLKLIYSAHDGHLSLNVGATWLFTFSPQGGMTLVSVGETPTTLPKVYVYDDILNRKNSSPITLINGQDATQWLRNLTWSEAWIEEHAVYNDIFTNSALLVDEGVPADALSGLKVYPGSDFNLTFANGTTLAVGFQATVPPIFTQGITGRQLYEKHVVASASNSTSSTSTSSSATPKATPTGFSHLPKPYPANPIVVQKQLNANPGQTDSGYVTGYFLNESSVAVLSVPSFNMLEEAAESFDVVVGQFLNMSKTAGMKKVIIDLQGNYGGTSTLATDLFKHFFPQIDPFDGSRYRAWSATKTMLPIYSDSDLLENATLAAQFVDFPFVAQSYDDINKKPFKSWEDLYGPVSSYDDTFTNIIRENFSNPLYDYVAQSFVTYGYANRSTDAEPPYAPEDILMVLDGLCTSTCSVFVEKMKTEAGVRQLAFGGLPDHTPMQGDSGSRGANSQSLTNLHMFLEIAAIFQNSTIEKLFPEMKVMTSPFTVHGGEVNFKDQIRRNDLDLPIQFLYEASDCRLFYTPEMLSDYTVLWQAAADAIWGNASCVQGSTGQPSSGQNVTETTKPDFSSAASTSSSPMQTYSSDATTATMHKASMFVFLAQIFLLAVTM